MPVTTESSRNESSEVAHLEDQMGFEEERIIQVIYDAFRDVQRPPHSEILHFPNTGDEMWIESFLETTETHWWDIPAESMEQESSALTVFSPAAFRYYLPAYMTWELRHYTSSHSNTVDHIMYDLNLSHRSSDTYGFWKQRFRVLSREQGKAVLAFLEFMSQVPGDIVDSQAATRAIESYWGRYRDP